MLLDDRLSQGGGRRRRRPRGAADLRAGGPARSHLLRSGHAPRRHRDLRRALPRHQQRRARAGARADARLRREGDLRLSLRLRGDGRALRARAAAPRRRRWSGRIHHQGGTMLGTSRGEPGARRDGRQPGGAGDRRAVRHRRRRHAARRDQARRRDRAAQAADRRRRDPQDHRQRHPLHRSQLRLRERVRRRRRGDPQRARRGDRRAQRHRPGQADGAPLGVHRLPRGAGLHRRELRAHPRGAAAARRRARLARAPRAAAGPARRTRSSSSPRGRGRSCAPPVAPAGGATAATDASGNARLKDIGLVLRDRINAALRRARHRHHAQVHRPQLPDPQRAGLAVGQRLLLEHGPQRRPRRDGRQHRDARSAAGTAASSTCRCRWPRASASRSTSTTTSGCRSSNRPASPRPSADVSARALGFAEDFVEREDARPLAPGRARR